MTAALAPSETPQRPPSTKIEIKRSYKSADFPQINGREEEWRFTPIKRLRGLAKAEGEALGKVAYATEALPDGVTFVEVGREDPRIGAALTPFDRISAWAYEQARAAGALTIAKETQLTEPVTLKITGQGAGSLTAAHLLVDVGELAEATVVLEHTGSVTLADNVEITVGNGARLTLITVADWDADAVQAQHQRIRLGRDATIQHLAVTLGGDVVRQYTSVEYTGRGGDAELNGLYFASVNKPGASASEASAQHLEHRLLADHSQPDCRSNVNYRGALQGKGAHTVWVGDVIIRAEATGTDTYEINRNLVLTDGARADSVPNLEIETGEVAGAGHASATGRFDDEQLFYLMARGIPEAAARKLVVRGFFAELLQKIPVPALRERLEEAIEQRLAETA